MSKKNNISLTQKLLITLILITLSALIVQTISTYNTSKQYYYAKTSENITVQNNAQKSRIEAYFSERINNLQSLVNNEVVTHLYDEMSQCFDSLSAIDSSVNLRNYNYVCIYNKYINFFTRFINNYEFDDFYLIESEEALVYFNVQKRKDLGLKLYRDKNNTPLERLVRTVTKTGKIFIQDFEEYRYANQQEFMFIGMPITRKNKTIAVAVVSLTDKQINNIINESFTSNNSDECYLVGLNSDRESEYRCTNRQFGYEIGKPINGEIIDAALKKEETGLTEITRNGTEYLVRYTPLRIKNLTWGLFTSTPKMAILTPLQTLIYNNIWVTLILLTFVAIIGIQIAKGISEPIMEIRNNLLMLSRGILPKREFNANSSSEISQIKEAFNLVVERIRKYIVFSNKIGNQQLDAEFEDLNEEDILGNSLLVMQRNLKKAAEDSKLRQIDEEKQKWTTSGIAKFGDILRMNYASLSEHADNIIQNLVGFLNVNQGGIFLHDEENNPQVLRLLACFAYDRKKYLQKEIGINEGLIGACYTEKETIYMTNIPDDYVNISSGLGSGKPKALLIVPLKMDIKVLGTIELISFKEFEKHEIEFVEKIAENIASSIYSSQINTQTQILLNESQEKSEQMAAQEEEMRQNMEELQATQEEASRREAESSYMISAMERSVMLLNLNLEGKIIDMNNNFAETLNIDKKSIKNTQYNEINSTLRENDDFLNEIIRNGHSKTAISKIEINDKIFYLKETFSLIRDCYEEPLRIIDIATDITKETELDQNK